MDKCSNQVGMKTSHDVKYLTVGVSGGKEFLSPLILRIIPLQTSSAAILILGNTPHQRKKGNLNFYVGNRTVVGNREYQFFHTSFGTDTQRVRVDTNNQ